jgi:hypothetical protein
VKVTCASKLIETALPTSGYKLTLVCIINRAFISLVQTHARVGMSIKLLFNNIAKASLASVFLAATLTACGGTSSPSDLVVIPAGIPTNTISHAYFRDQDGDTGKLAGSVTLKATASIFTSHKNSAV